jgi:hypothetical protein
MAKAPASDSIMTADKMKPLLALSKKEPVQAAIGLSSDGEGIILLDKKAKPKKVAAMLRTSAGKAKLQLNPSSVRFGRAEVDTDYDPGMVRFFINKDAPGNMRVKLVEVVKRIPYQKVEINVDPSLEAEPEEDAEGAADGAMAGQVADPAPETTRQTPAQPEAATAATTQDADLSALRAELAQLIPLIGPAAGSDADRLRDMKMDAGDAVNNLKQGNAAGAAEALRRLKILLGVTAGEQPNGAAPEAPAALAEQPDPAALTAALAALIRRIPEAAGANPVMKGELMKLATDANAALKSQDLARASEEIARLRERLDAGGGQTTPAETPTTETETEMATEPAEPHDPDEFLTLFRDAKDEVDAGLERLRGALLATGDDEMARIAEHGVYGMTNGGGVDLMKVLFDLYGTPKDEAGPKLDAARQAAAAYKAAVFADGTIDLVDNNPFGVEVGFRAKLTPVLDMIANAA